MHLCYTLLLCSFILPHGLRSSEYSPTRLNSEYPQKIAKYLGDQVIQDRRMSDLHSQNIEATLEPLGAGFIQNSKTTAEIVKLYPTIDRKNIRQPQTTLALNNEKESLISRVSSIMEKHPVGDFNSPIVNSFPFSPIEKKEVNFDDSTDETQEELKKYPEIETIKPGIENFGLIVRLQEIKFKIMLQESKIFRRQSRKSRKQTEQTINKIMQRSSEEITTSEEDSTAEEE